MRVSRGVRGATQEIYALVSCCHAVIGREGCDATRSEKNDDGDASCRKTLSRSDHVQAVVLASSNEKEKEAYTLCSDRTFQVAY